MWCGEIKIGQEATKKMVINISGFGAYKLGEAK
jgi:hypothetical protein